MLGAIVAVIEVIVSQSRFFQHACNSQPHIQDDDYQTYWSSPPGVVDVELVMAFPINVSVFDVRLIFDQTIGPATKISITYRNNMLNDSAVVVQNFAKDCVAVCFAACRHPHAHRCTHIQIVRNVLFT